MHVDRRNTRADHFAVTDVDLRGDGSPIMLSLPGGTVVSKTIEYTTTMCPECEDHEGENTIAAWTDDLGDEICPICGFICNGNRKQMWPEDFNFGSRGGFEGIDAPALNDAAPMYPSAIPSRDGESEGTVGPEYGHH
ncbi:hypothetical protein [Natronorubrum bangense]|uniref:Uncharacterized protein n=2 Tax=Natronorubrum bangense TaxID=61858 RepID=L9WKD7_9EURY|nr:hypothetical protein [Natronorubrum bangense]ELY49852.1 hypothetical protein C494_07575 [Natronorubrum bangense JCM 10635]QCC55473.1 hypothetical protein DV706_13945 [Natronorubrum bangense]